MAALWDWAPLILSVIGVIGVGGVLMVLGLWPVVSSFLIGTKLGGIILTVSFILLALAWAFISGKRKGISAEIGRQKGRNFKAAQKRVKTDAKIRTMPMADRRKELSKWVRG